MHALFWILAFLGVVMIYAVPFFGVKTGMTEKTVLIFKIIGVVIAVIGLLALYLTDGFK